MFKVTLLAHRAAPNCYVHLYGLIVCTNGIVIIINTFENETNLLPDVLVMYYQPLSQMY